MNRRGLTYRAGTSFLLYERYRIVNKLHICPRLAILFIKVNMHPYNLNVNNKGYIDLGPGRVRGNLTNS